MDKEKAQTRGENHEIKQRRCGGAKKSRGRGRKLGFASREPEKTQKGRTKTRRKGATESK